MHDDIDFNKITTLSYQELIKTNQAVLPINLKSIIKANKNSIRVSSYENYANKTGISVEELTLNGIYSDGIAINELRPGFKLILYQKDKYPLRRKYTVLHELGHFKNKHTMHGEKEEIEANFYASEVLIPDIIIWELIQREVKINKTFLQNIFSVSEECAEKKMDKIHNWYMYENEYDDIILNLFKNYLDAIFPYPKSHNIDDFFESKEKERLNWI